MPGAQRIKVFYFIPHLEQGGAERQILALIDQLPARFEPVLCLYHDAVHYREQLPPGQPRHVLGVERMSLAAYAELKRIIAAEKPAIVHSYRDKANFWARLAARAASVPVVISSCRARMLQLRFLLAERWLAARTSQVTVNSQGTRRELATLAGVPAERIQVIHNFLDLEHFRPPSADERAAARERWRLAPGQRALLIPGRLSLQKHQLGALLALDRLERAGRLPEGTVLLLAGRARDRRIAGLIDGLLARRPTLARAVRILDAQRDVRSLYWASDLLLLPSLFEGLPNAALEGCACGLPALLSHAANLDGIVAHGESGLEVPTADRAALAAALDRLLSLPDAELATMGRRARARMTERFAPERIRDEVLALYDRLLREAGVEILTEPGAPAS